MLKTGSSVDATPIAAPSSTKDKTGERVPQTQQIKKGNQWHFGMKVHIGADTELGLVHSVIGTEANLTQSASLFMARRAMSSVMRAAEAWPGETSPREST